MIINVNGGERSKSGNPAYRPVCTLRGRWWTWRQQRVRNSVLNTLKNTCYLKLVVDIDYLATTIDNTFKKAGWESYFSSETSFFSQVGSWHAWLS